MNSYERVKTALELKGESDRVPIVEFVIDPKVIKGVCPEAKDAADFAEIMGLDNSLVKIATMRRRQEKNFTPNAPTETGKRIGENPEDGLPKKCEIWILDLKTIRF